MRNILVQVREPALSLLDSLKNEKRLASRGAVVEWLIEYWRSHDEHDEEVGKA